MASVLGIFDIGKRALLANQRALLVTSHNIANINTPGYTRQEVIFEEAVPFNAQPGQIGSGMKITKINRIFDKFIELQMNAESQNFGNAEIKKNILQRVEVIFKESDKSGINNAISQLFNAFHDLSLNPDGATERSVVLSRGEILSTLLNKSYSDLSQIQQDLNTQLKSVISEVNDLASQIADLNEKISRTIIDGQEPNDYRDKRNVLLNELGQKTDISYFEDSLGQVTVMIGGQYPIVEARSSASLVGINKTDNSGFINIGIDMGNGNTIDITNNISNGSISGLLYLRDTMIPKLTDDINLLSASLTKEINIQHRNGYDLNSNTGNDFFSSLSITSKSKASNNGSASIGSGSILSLSSLTLHNYEIRFTSPTAFDIVDVTSGSAVSSGNTYTSGANIDFDGIRVVITDGTGTPQTGDIFTVSSTENAAKDIGVAITDTNTIAASSSSAGLPGDNGNALLLAELENSLVLSNSTDTFNGFYNSIAEWTGAESRKAQDSFTIQELIQQELGNMREEVSGVSLDEETANLIKFQQAFEAGARLITMADELLQTIVNLRR
ncbi:MAG: flagellar hook-associated protein FlgK [Nitrospirota bacterium]